jgi:hypothetical protein
MKYILIPLIAVITGCSTTVPVSVKFPDAPQRLLQPCPALSTVKDDVKLSELTSTVADNYQTYHGCANTVNGWIDWYKTQKNIFDKASKN